MNDACVDDKVSKFATLCSDANANLFGLKLRIPISVRRLQFNVMRKDFVHRPDSVSHSRVSIVESSDKTCYAIFGRNFANAVRTCQACSIFPLFGRNLHE